MVCPRSPQLSITPWVVGWTSCCNQEPLLPGGSCRRAELVSPPALMEVVAFYDSEGGEVFEGPADAGFGRLGACCDLGWA